VLGLPRPAVGADCFLSKNRVSKPSAWAEPAIAILYCIIYVNYTVRKPAEHWRTLSAEVTIRFGKHAPHASFSFQGAVPLFAPLWGSRSVCDIARGKWLTHPKVRHPEVRKRARVFFSGLAGPRDPVLKIQQANRKVPPACSHAEECACSLTAVGMTWERKRSDLHDFQIDPLLTVVAPRLHHGHGIRHRRPQRSGAPGKLSTMHPRRKFPGVPW
jgi:hypothetical protein